MYTKPNGGLNTLLWHILCSGPRKLLNIQHFSQATHKCTSYRKLCKELILESLESRRRFIGRHLCTLIKVISNGHPAFQFKLIPKKSHQYITGNVSDIATYQCRSDAFEF